MLSITLLIFVDSIYEKPDRIQGFPANLSVSGYIVSVLSMSFHLAFQPAAGRFRIVRGRILQGHWQVLSAR